MKAYSFAMQSKRLGAAAAVTMFAMTTFTGAVVAADTQVTIKGGQIRGAFNRTASAWAVLMTKEMKGVQASAKASAGSLDNARSIDAGQAQLGLVFASDLFNAYRGTGAFKKPHKNIRVLTYLFGSVGHFVVPADSSIKKLADIQGKTISMGGPGSGSAKSLTALVTHMGLWGKFKAVYAGRKSPEALRNGKVAAYNWHPGLGNAMIRDTATMMKIRFVDMNAPAKASGFYDKFPYFAPTKIPAGTYPNVGVDTMTFGTGTLMIANKGWSAEQAYQALKTVYSDAGKKFLVSSAGGVAKQMTKANGIRFALAPLHEGAVKFWKEQGKTIPAGLIAK